MLTGLHQAVFIGLGIACVGLGCRGYMDLCLRRHGRYRGWKHNTEREYFRLMKELKVPRWPLFAAIIFVPLGMILMFGAIIYSNHMRLR